jgi:hypothetical protein
LALSPDGNILAALSSNASLFFLDLREMSALTDE